MFQLNEQFLSDVGLGDMPEDQKKPFLQHIYDELEIRVGTRLSEGMTDSQLEEFESIIDRKEDIVLNWLEANVPDFANEDLFKQLQQKSNLTADDINLKSEYAATKWLEVNRPDYKDVVAAVLEQIKAEVSSNKDAILGKG